jgi:hypothetical protein
MYEYIPQKLKISIEYGIPGIRIPPFPGCGRTMVIGYLMAYTPIASATSTGRS